MTKDGCLSQTDVIFVVMDALESVEVLVLHYELSCSNRVIVANQNTHASCLSAIPAQQEMR